MKTSPDLTEEICCFIGLLEDLKTQNAGTEYMENRLAKQIIAVERCLSEYEIDQWLYEENERRKGEKP